MLDFSAWQAMANGENFGWYLILGGLVAGLGYRSLRKGLGEFLGKTTDLPHPQPDRASRRMHEQVEMQEAKLVFREKLHPFKQDSAWRQGRTREASQLALIVQFLPSLGGPDLGVLSQVATLRSRLIENGFQLISGQLAQHLANHRQPVLALTDTTAALVMPGEMNPLTPYGPNNPWVLWLAEEGLVELQAVMVFGAQTRPVYFGRKDLS